MLGNFHNHILWNEIESLITLDNKLNRIIFIMGKLHFFNIGSFEPGLGLEFIMSFEETF